MSFGRKTINDKILLLGMDGMDPRLTQKYIKMGKMPNVAEYVRRGASAKDLILLGGHPTVTPPMWTTLACGCYANVHGITGFSRNIPGHIDRIGYNMDSRHCRAEQLWNVFAEAGRKTLVWHWPGSAWPPSSDSENLMVIDGTSPGSVGMSTAQIEGEFLLSANTEIKEVTYRKKAASEAHAACVITDLDLDEEKDDSLLDKIASLNNDDGLHIVIMNEEGMTSAATEIGLDLALSPLKEASGWAAAPANAKEFTVLLSGGLIRRPALVLADENGKYNKVAVYKSKKDIDPLVVMTPGVMAREIIDESLVGDKKYKVNRSMKVLELAEDGSKLSMYISPAMDIENDSVYSPKRLYKEIVENVGYPTPTSNVGCQSKTLITDCMLDMWYGNADWQAKAIHHLIESEDLDIVFSHFHAIDLEEHMFIKHLAQRKDNRLPHEAYEKFMEDLYVQADYYLGQFLHFLDEGWTIMIFSDHAQVASTYGQRFLGDASGVNLRIMQELGFTEVKRDENGNETDEIDWAKTIAVANREGHIYLNLKGREPHGIVDPKDRFEVEEDIMTALYGYKDKVSGKRIVSVALRNRDAVLLGQGGPEAGDICYWMAEGYNFDHADCLSTTLGECDTSVSPIFIAAGKGIKEGFTTERIIRQIDFAPTIAAIGGVRMPRQCEGAPAYQIFTEEF